MIIACPRENKARETRERGNLWPRNWRLKSPCRLISANRRGRRLLAASAVSAAIIAAFTRQLGPLRGNRVAHEFRGNGRRKEGRSRKGYYLEEWSLDGQNEAQCLPVHAKMPSNVGDGSLTTPAVDLQWGNSTAGCSQGRTRAGTCKSEKNID